MSVPKKDANPKVVAAGLMGCKVVVEARRRQEGWVSLGSCGVSARSSISSSSMGSAAECGAKNVERAAAFNDAKVLERLHSSVSSGESPTSIVTCPPE